MVSVESVNCMPIVRIKDREDLLAAVYATRKILRKKVQLTIGIDNHNLVKHQFRKSGIDSSKCLKNGQFSSIRRGNVS